MPGLTDEEGLPRDLCGCFERVQYLSLLLDSVSTTDKRNSPLTGVTGLLRLQTGQARFLLLAGEYCASGVYRCKVT